MYVLLHADLLKARWMYLAPLGIPALLVNFLLLKLFPRFHWQRLDEFLPDLLPKLLLQLLFELLPRIFEILVLLWLHLLALFFTPLQILKVGQ